MLRPCKDHENNEYRSVIAKCRKYGLKDTTYNERIRRGWNEEKALTTPVGHYFYYDGKRYSSIIGFCRENNISCYSSISNRVHKGKSVEEAINIFKQTHVYLKETNKWYENFNAFYKDMCKLKGIAYVYNDYRIACSHYREGFTIEEIFANKRLISKGEYLIQNYLDSLGIKYEHDNQAYRKHIKITEIKYRGFRFDFFLKHKGQLIAIEFDGEQHFNPNHYSKSDYTIRKNNFNKICNQDEKKNQMCREYGVALCRIRYDQEESIFQIINDLLANPKKYLKRYNPYLNNEEYYAIRKEFDIIIDSTYGNKPYYEDGFGNKFVTLNEMCKFHGMSRQTYRYRIINMKMTTEEALSKKVNYGRKMKYKGKTYKSLGELCRDNNISYSTLHSRLTRNWPSKIAIDTPKLPPGVKIKNNQFRMQGAE